MKALRITLAVLGGAVLLLVLVAVIIVRSFDLNDYKDEIAAYVETRTGRTLSIDGNIEFSLFPWFAIETGGVTLSDDPEFGERSFATVDSLSARLRVWPLLRRRIEIGTVTLDGVNLNLGIDANGRGNWSSLIATTEDPAPPAIDAATPARPAFAALAVEGIVLRNVRVLWHDSTGEVSYILRDLTLATGPINNNEPVDISVSLAVLDVASQAALELELETTATVRPNIGLEEINLGFRALDPRAEQRAAGSVEIDTLALQNGIVLLGPATIGAELSRPPVGPAALAVTAELGSIEIDTAAETLYANGLAARIGDVRLAIDLRGEQVLSEPHLSGALSVTADRLGDVIAMLGIESDTIPNARDLGGLSARSDFDYAADTGVASLAPFAIATLGMDATGQARLGADGTATATIDVPAFRPGQSLRGLLGSLLPAEVDLAAVASAALNASLNFDRSTGRLDVDRIELGLDDLELAGRVQLQGAPSQRVSGALEATGLDNRLLAALFGAWLPENLVEADLGDFRVAASFDYDRGSGTGVLAPLELSAYGLAGDGELTIASEGGQLSVSGRAALDEFAPRELLARFELPVPESADSGTLRSASLAASFETRGPNGEFRDVVMALDDSRITGELSVENFADPSYRFLLRADRIDVDRYLPPERDDARESPDGERAVGDLRIAAEPLTATVVSGTASVGHLTIGGMQFEQLAAEVAFGGGRAAVNSVRTELYGGEFAGSLSVDATSEPGQVHLIGNLSNVDVNPLLRDLLGDSYVSGTGNIELDLQGRGDTINEVLAAASGRFDVSLRDGEIEGVNLGRELCRAVNLANRLPPPAAAPDVTAYSVMQGDATVSDGNASFTSLSATTAYLELTSAGSLRLVDLWWDLRNRAQPKGSVPIAGCEELNGTLADDPVAIPFTLKGRFPDVEPGFDISQLLEAIARRKLRQRVEEKRDEVVEDLIRGIFN